MRMSVYFFKHLEVIQKAVNSANFWKVGGILDVEKQLCIILVIIVNKKFLKDRNKYSKIGVYIYKGSISRGFGHFPNFHLQR